MFCAELTVAIIICPVIAAICLPGRSHDRPSEEQKPTNVAEPSPSVDAPLKDIHQAALQMVDEEFSLSARESDVLALLAEGWRAAAIAEKLVLSKATVKNHMNSIYGKLDVHSQDELLRLIEERRSRLEQNDQSEAVR